MITLTDKAFQQLLKLMEEQSLPKDKFSLRVGVKGGGCSGLSYVMDFDSEIKDTDTIVEVQNGFKVLIDKKSLLYLVGTILTYSDGLNGRGFQWENPNANRTCGCGESFAI